MRDLAGRRRQGHGLGLCRVNGGRHGQLVTVVVAFHRAAREQGHATAFDRQWPGDHLVRQCQWESQKGQFGYARRLRWVFFDDGGYVAMCKRYRQHATQTGLLKTLTEKRIDNPNVDLLVGAVNVWCWDKDAAGICRELQAAGIRRILWSNGADPETLRRLNAMGVLTSRYDIYQDVMDPANFPKLRWLHSDWTTGGWPKDLMLDAHGQWLRGWEVEGKDGQRYPCGVLCVSLGPYRVPDAGRDMRRIWDAVPEQVAKFQTGHFYRLPGDTVRRRRDGEGELRREVTQTGGRE